MTTSKLDRCTQLSDPVNVAEKFLKASLLLTVIVMGGTTLALSTLAAATDGAGPAGAGLATGLLLMSLMVAGSLVMLKAVVMVMRDSKHPQHLCLFLRAFRSDATADQLRAWLKACLGTKFKLTGIRPPVDRAAAVLTFLSPLITGLRYAGSRQFELEAPDRNWMARLLASFAHTRFVFIDVRDMTPHVLDEIQLAWQVFGQERIIFITDDTKQTMEWITVISNLLAARRENAPLKLLTWPVRAKPDAATFLAQVNALIATIPVGETPIPEAAVSFVESKVQPADWDVRFFERPWAFVIASLLGTSIVTAVISMLFPPTNEVVTWTSFILLQAFFWMAWNRARQQRNFARQINPEGPPSARRLWGSAILMFTPTFFVGGLAALAVIALETARTRAEQTSAISSCKQVILSMKLHANDNNGFYPDSVPPDPAEMISTTSNAAFRLLFKAGLVEEERIFGCKHSEHTPDNNIGRAPDFVEALRPGENHWAMTAGLTDYSSGMIPLVFEAPLDAYWPPRWDMSDKHNTKRGRAWPDKTIIIGFNDGHVERCKLDEDGHAVFATGMPVFPIDPDQGEYKILDIEP